MKQENATLMVLDHPQDFRNIIQGATVFSSGGGGSKKLALQFLEQSGITAPGVRVMLCNADLVPDDSVIAFVAELFAPEKMLDHPDFTCGENAYADLMKLGESGPADDGQGVLFGEIGAVNVAVPMIIAFKSGNFMIDAASVGRSVAELNMTVFAGDNIPMGALVVAARGSLSDHFSQTDYPQTPEEAETFITDTMAQYEKEYQDVAGFALYKMSGNALKQIENLPKYGITQSMAIGEVMFEAPGPADAYAALMPPPGQGSGKSLAAIISKPVFPLFDGRVSEAYTTSGDQSDGMMIYQNPANKNETYTVYYENENVLSTYEVTDGITTVKKYSVIAPDAICYLLKDAFWQDGLSYSNSEVGPEPDDFFKIHGSAIIGIPYPDMRCEYLEQAFLGGIQKVLTAIREDLHMDPKVTCPDQYIPVETLNRIPKPLIEIIPNGWTGNRAGVGSRKYLIRINCGDVPDISIRYTMDNSLPTLDTPEYTGPIHYLAGMGGTLRVIAWDLTKDNTGTYKYFSRETTAPLPCSPW